MGAKPCHLTIQLERQRWEAISMHALKRCADSKVGGKRCYAEVGHGEERGAARGEGSREVKWLFL